MFFKNQFFCYAKCVQKRFCIGFIIILSSDACPASCFFKSDVLVLYGSNSNSYSVPARDVGEKDRTVCWSVAYSDGRRDGLAGCAYPCIVIKQSLK